MLFLACSWWVFLYFSIFCILAIKTIQLPLLWNLNSVFHLL
jgi:hypothetical protein